MRSSKSSPERPPSNTISRYLPLVLWLGFISFASSGNFSAANTSRIIGPLVLWLYPNTSPETLLTVHMITRKMAHFAEYAVLGFLAARAFRGSLLRRKWFLVSLALIVVYALLDEYHQSFVPSRTATVYDSFIDIAGGLTALAIVWQRQRRRERRGDGFERASNSPV